MRDWRDTDPAYHPNDARHPRNRPPGAEPAFEVPAEVRAGLVAALRVLARSSAPVPAPTPVRRHHGNPAMGRQLSLAEKQEVMRRFERERARHLARLGRPVVNEVERQWIDMVASRIASRAGHWW